MYSDTDAKDVGDDTPDASVSANDDLFMLNKPSMAGVKLF